MCSVWKSRRNAATFSFHPVDFEAVPDSLMMEIAVYGLPVRMPHWPVVACATSYQPDSTPHGAFAPVLEVVFPGNSGHALSRRGNGLAENVLVTAHVLGHADFSRNNLLFRRCQEQVSEHIVEHAASHARQIQRKVIEKYGAERVEPVLDAALALEQHIDVDPALRRERYPEYLAEPCRWSMTQFRKRFAALDALRHGRHPGVRKRAPVPPHPERDLLWFIANYAPELEGWERDIFLAVREESFYFYPVFATQIMNEGWASYWHARLLREADFMPQQAYLDAIKAPLRRGAPALRPTSRWRSASIRITWDSRCGRRSSRRRGSKPRAASWSRTMTSASCVTT